MNIAQKVTGEGNPGPTDAANVSCTPSSVLHLALCKVLYARADMTAIWTQRPIGTVPSNR